MKGGSEVGEGGSKVISPLDGGGPEVILTLIQGVQLYFKAYFANFRTPPPDNYCTVPKSFLQPCFCKSSQILYIYISIYLYFN